MNDIKLDCEKQFINGSRFYEFTKRLIDITCSLIGLIILSPIFIITAVIIKVTSKGSVIFSQKRVGKCGMEFDMYKFRSMVFNAEELKKELVSKNEMSEPMFKMKCDPRALECS